MAGSINTSIGNRQNTLLLTLMPAMVDSVQVQVPLYFIQLRQTELHPFSGKTIPHQVSGDLSQMVRRDQADLEEMVLSVLL